MRTPVLSCSVRNVIKQLLLFAEYVLVDHV